MSWNFLETSIEYLKGVGPKRAELLKKELGVFTFYDLLMVYPFRYVDKSKFYLVNEIREDLPYVQLKGKITNVKAIGKHRPTRLTADFTDKTGTLKLVWFKGLKWYINKFKPNTEYIVFGQARGCRRRRSGSSRPGVRTDALIPGATSSRGASCAGTNRPMAKRGGHPRVPWDGSVPGAVPLG